MCVWVPNLHSCGTKLYSLKYQISGLAVTHRLCVAKKTREREKVSRLLLHPLSWLYYTQTRARKGEERERAAVLIMKKSSGSSFQNLQGTLNFVSSKSFGVVVVILQRREHNCASPSEITFSPIGGSSFSSSPSFAVALFCSRLSSCARKQQRERLWLTSSFFIFLYHTTRT